MGKIIHICYFAIGVSAMLIMAILSGCEKRVAIIDKPTEVMEEAYPKYYGEKITKVIEILQPNQEIEVINYQYEKDFMVYKVRLRDGRVGYIIAGDEFHVVEK